MKHTPIFFAERDGPWYPTLRLLHQYPEMMKKLRVDKGALKFVMSGANIMCPGLTSPGATIHDEVHCLCECHGKCAACTHLPQGMTTNAIPKEVLADFAESLQTCKQAMHYRKQLFICTLPCASS